MGCFSTCLPKSGRRKYSRRSSRSVKAWSAASEVIEPSLRLQCDQKVIVDSLITLASQKPEDPPPDSRDEERVQPKISGRKKVTFDLNIKVYEELPAERVSDEMERNTNEVLTLLTERVSDQRERNNDVVKVTADEEEEEDVDDNKFDNCQSDSSSSSVFTYPPNYRYQDCQDSDDEYNEILTDVLDDDEDYDDDDDEEAEAESEVKHDQFRVMEESSGSLFSLSADSRRTNLTNEVGDKEVCSPISVLCLPRGESQEIELNQNNELHDENASIDSVLDPVENLAHWKARTREASSAHQVKENAKLHIDSNIPTIREPNRKTFTHRGKHCLARSKDSDQDTAVDASLSSWLIETKAVTPDAKSGSSASVGNHSSSRRARGFEDRPILGALTVEEIKQFSASSSPRRSPSRSPDDMPIIGTVGSHWSDKATDSEGGSFRGRMSSITSKCTEDKKVTWNPVPFETRLEMALQNGIADA